MSLRTYCLRKIAGLGPYFQPRFDNTYKEFGRWDFMAATIEFPPELLPGSRVWTHNGFLDHGPMDGPLQNIEGPQAGTIESRSQPYGSFDSYLYAIKWENGQQSKHYEGDLIPIGDSKSYEEFLGSFSFEGPIRLGVGPRGGFKVARFEVRYKGEQVQCETRSRRLWSRFIEPVAEAADVGFEQYPI